MNNGVIAFLLETCPDLQELSFIPPAVKFPDKLDQIRRYNGKGYVVEKITHIKKKNRHLKIVGENYIGELILHLEGQDGDTEFFENPIRPYSAWK